MIFTVCCFPCYLMAFDCQELKGLLTYLVLWCSAVFRPTEQKDTSYFISNVEFTLNLSIENDTDISKK